MQGYIYSVIAVLAIAIHLIINFNMLTNRDVTTLRGVRYRSFLLAILAYYITDASWGVFAGLDWTRVLFLNTALYYIAIALTVFTWCNFVVAFLDISGWKARMISWIGYAILSMYVVLLTANFFNHCIFLFDENGDYAAGPLRYLIFHPLVALNVLMAALVFVKTNAKRDSFRRRDMVVFTFCLIMSVAIILQIVWPLWPYYAMGCFIGTCLLHVFVVETELAELRQAVIEREQAAKHMAELESALVRARTAEKARSTFFSIVSHDIRTPLNAILGYSELLQYGIKNQAERDEALEAIRASGTTLLQLVNDVLDLAKMDSGKMTLRLEPVRLSQLTDEVFASFRLMASEKGVELINRTSSVPPVLLDGHRFRQILFNLVGNGVKFTDRGTVTVCASYSGSNLEVSVSDTGCGIASDMLTHILDPFVQVQDPTHAADRSGGTGLGLSICRSLVEVMGGELVVESELGKGSTLKASIPGVVTSELKEEAAVEAKPAVALKKLPKHVLVVDDSPVNRSVFTAFLKRAGVASIDYAGDGGEALSRLDAAVKEGRPHDLVISDFWMPNMNGFELIEKMRADPRFAKLPVYAVTADTEFNRDERTRHFTGILLKPLTYDKLVGILAAMA